MIEWPRKTQRKRDICTFDYSVRVMNHHAGLTLTRPTGTTFSLERSIKLPQGKGCLEYPIYNLVHTVSKLTGLKTRRNLTFFFLWSLSSSGAGGTMMPLVGTASFFKEPIHLKALGFHANDVSGSCYVVFWPRNSKYHLAQLWRLVKSSILTLNM